jgi:hypothetical protein
MESIPVTHREEFVSEVTCNRCGKGHKTQYSERSGGISSSHNNPNMQHQEISLSFSPHSMFSTQKWKFDLCEECLLSIIRDFKLVPEGFMETALPNRFPQLQFDNWKQTGKWDWRYGYSDDMLMSMGILPEGQIKNIEIFFTINDENTCSPERAKEIANKIIESLKKKGGQL